MLEIKCPPKRKFTKTVPKHYWYQMQGQLECCNLEECDFLQVKFSEYLNNNIFYGDYDEIRKVLGEKIIGDDNRPTSLVSQRDKARNLEAGNDVYTWV